MSVQNSINIDTLKQKLSVVSSLLDDPNESHKPMNACQTKLSKVFMNPKLMGHDSNLERV